MYQVIDDPEEETIEPRAGFSVFPILIGALLAGVVFFVVWLASPGQPTTPGQTIDTPASRATYLTALKDSRPAFRRARLLDYQRAYPDTDRANAIQDQLDVINASEQRDWDSLTRVIYDVRAKLDDKQTALTSYEAKWDGSLMGGRGDELNTLRAAIDETIASEPLPDRALEVGKSPISDSIDSDVLAGARPKMAKLTPIAPPPPPVKPVEIKPVQVIVQPTIRRNASPNYPRSAKRKKVGAIVTLTMDIDAKGRVQTTEILAISAERYEKEFIKAAERAAMRTRFNPKTIDGVAVPTVGVKKRYIFRPN